MELSKYIYTFNCVVYLMMKLILMSVVIPIQITLNSISLHIMYLCSTYVRSFQIDCVLSHVSHNFSIQNIYLI